MDYEVKKPSQRITYLTWKPYGYSRRIRIIRARRRCIISKNLCVIEAKSAMQKSVRIFTGWTPLDMYVELGSFHHTSCWDLWRNFGKVPRWDLWKGFREVPDRMLPDEGGSTRRARPYAAQHPHLRGQQPARSAVRHPRPHLRGSRRAGWHHTYR